MLLGAATIIIKNGPLKYAVILYKRITYFCEKQMRV